MFLSVITVHFRELDSLRVTLESVKKLREGQQQDLFEWIVIDGGSDFSSDLELLDDVRTVADVFVTGPDKGLYDAMNIGLSHATGNYSIFMNAGDVFTDEFNLDQLEELCSSVSPIMVWGASYEREPGEKAKLKASRGIGALWYGMPTHHQAILMRTHEARLIKYDLEYKIAADFKLVCELSKVKSSVVSVIGAPLCIFELGGVSSTRFWLGLKEQQRIRKDVLEISFLSNGLIWLLKAVNRSLRLFMPGVYSALRYVGGR